LVAGERRLRAVRMAELATVAAIIRPAAESARESLETALTENLLRTDLSPVEEAAAYARLADTFGLSHDAIAVRLGRSRSSVSNTIRLLTLPAGMQRAVAKGDLTAGHAKAMLGLPDAAAQQAMFVRVMSGGWSVRQTERAVQVALRGTQTRQRPTKRSLRPDDEAVRRGLEARLGLPVALERNTAGGGRVILSFHDDEDLQVLYLNVGGQPM
jgi:ParB family chromosome partitioning protein